MPIYAFACAACGHQFDKLQKLSDADPFLCPTCGAEGQVHRQLTAPQFRLASGGWYETDFKKDGEKKSNLAGDAAKPAEAKPSETKETSKTSDTKPAESKPATSAPVAKQAD